VIYLGSNASDVENRWLTGFMTLSGIRSPLEFRVFHINGIALHVVLAGSATGKPLIFLHGFPEFWFAWRLQIDHFVSSGYRVIIPDQRGYNLSDKPAGIANYSIDLLARDVVGIWIPWRIQARSSSGTTGELLLPGTWLPDIRKGLAAPRY
jgi:hypothetical protein